jgi:hypothetical protein
MAVALLLAALAAAPVAAGRGFFNQIETGNADLCILYKGVECALHPECVTCHASVGSIDVCMETAIAIKLPTRKSLLPLLVMAAPRGAVSEQAVAC